MSFPRGNLFAALFCTEQAPKNTQGKEFYLLLGEHHSLE